jgi:hypothetical protein
MQPLVIYFILGGAGAPLPCPQLFYEPRPAVREYREYGAPPGPQYQLPGPSPNIVINANSGRRYAVGPFPSFQGQRGPVLRS